MQPEDVRRLQAVFIKADEDGDGALSVDEFKGALLNAAGSYDKYVGEQVDFFFSSLGNTPTTTHISLHFFSFEK